MFSVLGLLILLEGSFAKGEAEVNVTSLLFKKLPNQKPSVDPSVFKSPSIIVCSSICKRRGKCTGFGFQGPPETEKSECHIFETDDLEFNDEQDIYYSFYEKIRETAKDEEPLEDQLVFVAEEKSWLEANDYCALNHRGTLPIIYNEEDQKKLEDLVKKRDEINKGKNAVWLGLFGFDSKTLYKWTTQRFLEKDHYSKWAKDEPSRKFPDELCAAMYTEKAGMFGQWADFDCEGFESKFPFICEPRDLQYIRLMMPTGMYDDAQKGCISDLGWRLALIQSEDNQKEIEEYIGETSRSMGLWFGLSGKKIDEEVWLDGKKLADTGYTNWAPDHPDYPFPADSRCFVLGKEAKWTTHLCLAIPSNPNLGQALCERKPSE